MSETKSFEKMIVVGDDDQSIYAFRNTHPKYMTNFDEYIEHPVLDKFLVDNYRSVKPVISLANDLISENEHRTMKQLNAVRGNGNKVVMKGFHSKAKEREWIADEIERLIKNGTKPEDICVIDRKRVGLVDIGTRLTEKGIPWVSKVGQNLLVNSKVKGALGLCDAFYDPENTINYFNYLVVKHNGRIDAMNEQAYVQEIEGLKSIFMNMELLEFDEQRKIFHELLDALKEVEDDEIYEYFLELLYDHDSLPDELEYSRIFKKYGNVMEKKLDQQYVGVTLVTAHSSKGAEWPIVFTTLTNYDSARLHRTSAKAMDELEEVRRLLFVSMTRARDQLYMTGVYVAYGSEKEGYTYNQFVYDFHRLLKLPYDPVDHEREAKKAAKAAEAAAKKSSRRKKQSAFVGNIKGQTSFV